MFASGEILRWLRLKRYQYEVTMSLYMLEPWEKFMFNSIVFLIFSLIVVACSLYLPAHVATIANRAWFYYAGEEPSAAAAAASTASAWPINAKNDGLPILGEMPMPGMGV